MGQNEQQQKETFDAAAERLPTKFVATAEDVSDYLNIMLLKA